MLQPALFILFPRTGKAPFQSTLCEAEEAQKEMEPSGPQAAVWSSTPRCRYELSLGSSQLLWE